MQKIFVKIPFMSCQSVNVHANQLIKFGVGKLVYKFYLQIKLNIIFTSEFFMGSFFLFER